MRKLVVLESPYGNTTRAKLTRNLAYARKAVRDSLNRNEAPIASHLLYTQKGILDDDISSEREQGIEAGQAWLRNADACVVYIDLGITLGMAYGIVAAVEAEVYVEFREIEAEEG